MHKSNSSRSPIVHNIERAEEEEEKENGKNRFLY